MDINGWKYYNHAVIPSTSPHERTNLVPIQDKSVWKIGGGGTPLFARWTTEFDCGHETNWWYVIKDTPFDVSELKAKRRYEINKGNKNFEVREINPLEYKEELYAVQVDAFSAYPESYRPKVEKKAFLKGIDNWCRHTTIGAFNRENGLLCGYAFLEQTGGDYVKFSVQKTKPSYEKFGLNAALVFGVLEHYDDLLKNGGYICDGERSINHETKFQDYLEKYFGFRKAYCLLNVKYRPGLSWLIKALYPFRKILMKIDHVGLIHNVNAVLRMEEIMRAEKALRGQ